MKIIACKVLFFCVLIVIWGCNSNPVPEKTASVKNSVPSADPATMDPETRKLYDNWQELKKRKLRLVPVPKKITFQEEPVLLPGKAVIVLDNKTEEGLIAANEIISRIKELTGQTIPVKSEIQDGAYNIIIENRWPNDFSKDEARIKTENPYCREQAFAAPPAITRFSDGHL